VEGARLASKMAICDWNNFDTDRVRLIDSIRAGRANVAPFVLLAVDSLPQDQLQCAKVWAKQVFPNGCEPQWRGEVYKHERIRVGYVSADFHRHATAYLMAGLFECHDRRKFEVTAFSFGADDGSEMRHRLEHAFEHFIDVRSMGDEELARKMRSLEIEILVDLKGITQDARTGIFVRRPAPIQVNYLGYPGTMASKHFDYIIGDGRIIGEGDREHYSEKVVTLPFSYQANDDKRVISDNAVSRSESGLPDQSFVYCCFNQAYKITSSIFDCWMSILREVDGSVLWLFEGHPAAKRNLCTEAEKRGIDSGRLIFAGGVPPAEHLARHRLADLFLDTLPYNAHTTSSDALWTGLPVVTLTGETFASRVGASLLTAIGLPELITSTHEEYTALAVALGKDRERLAEIKERLALNRLTMPLFNTALFTKHLEAAYQVMSDRYRAVLPPDHFAIDATL
jgi:predicted O-linked N-acetylglucosamine transferase (SPINDLY family)